MTNRHREKVNIDENKIRPYSTKKTFAEASQGFDKFIINFFFKATPTKKTLKKYSKINKKQTPELYAIE